MSGTYFSITRTDTNDNRIYYPWFGIYYSNEVTGIYLAFRSDPNWCGPIYNLKAKFPNEGKHFEFDAEDLDDSLSKPAIWFKLSDTAYSRFNDDHITLEEQETILTSFYEEVIRTVYTLA